MDYFKLGMLHIKHHQLAIYNAEGVFYTQQVVIHNAGIMCYDATEC